MLVKKWMYSIPILLLVLALKIGCALSDGDNVAAYSYEIDVLYPEIFTSSSHTMTMNEWFAAVKLKQWWFQWDSYDALQSDGKILFKDEKLKTAFSASDIINDTTVIYCDFDFYGRGKKIGEITGTITLTNIFDPPPKVYIRSENWLTGKVNMREVTNTTETLNWTIPVYETYFQPNPQSQFTLSVLPSGSDYSLKVSVSTRADIDDANTNAGSLGTVSIKGVTLSGTINVTHNGEPVPYVGIWANYEVATTLQNTYLFSPEPNAPWTIILEPSDTNRDITFQVFGLTKQNWTISDMLFDTYAGIDPVYVSNQDKAGIVLDLGDR